MQGCTRAAGGGVSAFWAAYLRGTAAMAFSEYILLPDEHAAQMLPGNDAPYLEGVPARALRRRRHLLARFHAAAAARRYHRRPPS